MTLSKQKMEVTMISSQCIKPSCPTPEHLKIHKLSLLDQYIPSLYIPMILFYTTDDDNDTLPQRLKLLKQSLSETLTRFYPFAGIIKDSLSIDCNDQGVLYSEARANSSLNEFFKQPSLASLLHKLLPTQPSWHESTEGAQVAMIQVTSFACGGLAIGAIVSHMIADGAATSFFLNSWGAMARKAIHNYASPNFDAPPAIFPHSHAVPKQASVMAVCGPFFKTGKSATRRLAFGPTAIAQLRAKASSSRVPNPTRVEAVSALIWKSVMAALKANYGLVTQAVNMRRRADPAFPGCYMGNFLWVAPSSLRAAEEEMATELPNLVIKLREAITKVNCDFVKGLEGEGGCIRYGEVLKEMVEETSSFAGSCGTGSHGVAYVGYSSWCRFGLYDVDFGWGKPAWVTCTGSNDADTLFFNAVVLMDTPSGDGIEAWVYLDHRDMAVLEQDKHLLAFAALDPNPLDLNAPPTSF